MTEGTAITVTLSFSNLAEDSDRATTDYIFRADVLNADGCEDRAGGYGLGVDRKINLVDEDPETRAGTISAGCPAGDYTVRASISDANGGELASATADFSVAAPEPPASTDAALSGLALSGVTLEFDPATTTYTAEVGNDLAETTVTPTVNDDGATYVVRLDGAADDDGIAPLAVGENVVSVLVTAEDGETNRTYTVTVTRAEVPPERSGDATLRSLALSGVSLEFDPATTTYAAEVGNDLAETTVTPTVNDDGATYVVRLDGAADDDGTVPLAVGENVVSVLVTAEDGETSRTYAVTVTRAAPDPTVSIALAPSDTIIEGEGTEIAVTLSFGHLTFDDDLDTTDYLFRADVKDSEDGDADECEDQAGGYGLGVDRKINLVDQDPETRTATIPADCPAGVYTLRASISNSDNEELASATASFFVLPLYTAVVVEEPEEEEPRVARQTAGSSMSVVWTPQGGTSHEYAVTWTDGETCASGTNYYVYAKVGGTTEEFQIYFDIGNVASTVNTVTGTATIGGLAVATVHEATVYCGDREQTSTTRLVASVAMTGSTGGTFRFPATDSSLSALSLDGVSVPSFDAATTGYRVRVDLHVVRTTVSWTVSHAAASLVVTPADADTEVDGHQVDLALGANVITVVVTAQDESTTTYKVTVTRAAPSSDATLSALTLSGITFAFDSATTDYDVDAALTTAQTTVAATATHANASVAYSSPADADAGTAGHQVDLTEGGITTIAVTVTPEDTTADTKVYAVRVTRPQLGLSALTLSGAAAAPGGGDLRPALAAGVYDYEARFAAGAATATTTLSVTKAQSAASLAVVLNGAALTVTGSGNSVTALLDPLRVGRNTLTITLSATGASDRTYTLELRRASDEPTGWAVLNDFTLGAAHTVIGGMWSNGATMWVADRGAGTAYAKLFAYAYPGGARMAAQDFLTLESAGNRSITGIWSNNETMWVADFNRLKIYAYNLGTKARDADKDIGSGPWTVLQAAGIDNPLGIWSDDTTMWVADGDDNKLYAFDLGSKLRDASKEFPLTAPGNSEPSYIWSDGETMWVVNNDRFDENVKLYAYSMTTRRHLPHKDFNALAAAGNTSPRDIWGDGSVMWVANDGDRSEGVADTVYTYNYAVDSSDATLSGLTISPGAFSTAFSPATSAYTAGVGDSVTEVSVNATPTPGGTAAVTYGSSNTAAADGVVPLNAVDDTVITITVTAEDELATMTYTITVTRVEPALPVISSLDGQDVGGPFRVRFTFLKAENPMEALPVTDFVLGDITVSNGTASNLVRKQGRTALNGAIWEAKIRPVARGGGHDVVVSLAAGVVTYNQAASLRVTTRSDGRRPTATLRANVVYFEDGSQSSVITRPTGLHIGFDERVTGLAINDFEVTNGEIGYLDVDADGNGHAVLVPKVSESSHITVRLKTGAVQDLAFNSNAATEVVLHVSPDDTPPEIVRIRERLRRVDDDGTHVWALTFVFSEPVTGFTANDVALSSNGTKSTQSRANHEYGTRWAIDIESDDGETPITVSVAAGAFSDGNNTNTEAFSGEIDRSVPPPASDD